ncbi:MAG: glutamyl-tRNA reductase [Akkermansia sp.]|nr:glutamyl-tRNA reductase [Akkermansia sp.]
MLCLGLNHQSTPVAIREKFSVPKTRLAEAGAALRALPGVEECVLLSTCNRMEVYFWSDAPRESTAAILRHFSVHAPFPDALDSYFYIKEGTDALRHLCRVVSGLDSMVLGETEIFGQVKEAYSAALAAGLTGGRANRTFQHVFTIGKKVRSSTKITVGPTSVGAVAVQMAGNILGGLDGARVLMVGAGEVSRATAKALKSRGAESIFVANRSYDRALALAREIGGRVIRFSDWAGYLLQIDIVIVSTAASHYIVTPGLLHHVQEMRRERPLFLIDLSVPRNINPECSHIGGIHVFDIDTLHLLAAETRKNREKEIANCERMIDTWLFENAPELLGDAHHPDI